MTNIQLEMRKKKQVTEAHHVKSDGIEKWT